MTRNALPIYELEHELVAALRSTPRVVLEAPTGSGKSTQVPQILLDHGLLGEGEVVVLQPRRLPARMLAARVAAERGCKLGGEVGYQIRLDRVCSRETRIRFVTEGVLLRQMLSDPSLPGVAAICFDEFHERHLYGDITLARALQIQETLRPDLLLVVMSATLESRVLEQYMAPCAMLVARGRTYPVDIAYLQRSPGERPVWEVVAAEFERLAPATRGDVLVFLPGSYEINRTIEALRHTRAGGECVILPLHGELPPAEQDAAVARQPRRKIVVSTNVAETSLTIDGVCVVIDSGLAKIARFDPYRGINTLLTSRVSRASADQRAGRAGRTAPGVCLRLWTEREHGDRPAQELPEVRRVDLTEVVLTLKAAGVRDIPGFRWLEKPDAKALERALGLLEDLGALDAAGDITTLGRRMLAFPVHPRYARMLLAADDYGCVPEAATVAALTQGRPVLRRGDARQLEQQTGEWSDDEIGSDFFLLLRALRFAEDCRFDARRCETVGVHAGAAREAAALAKQFLQIAKAEGLYTGHSAGDAAAVRKCVLAGFPDQVAARMDAGTLRCQLVYGRRGVLARESVVQTEPLLVACEVREVEARGAERQVLLTLATAVSEEWLRELFPAGFDDRSEVSFDSTQRRVVARRIVRFRDLLLRSKETDEVPPDAAAALLAQEVEAGRCPLKDWDDAVDQWIARVNLAAQWFPEQELPPIGDADVRLLVEQICFGAVSYKDIKERPVWPVVKSWLSAAQAAFVDSVVPERIGVPNGKKFKIIYAAKSAPTVGIRIQDLYGVEGELKIANGRVPLVIEVLAPNQRPIQVTQNLSNFWKESYPRIKQELQRRYPKHEWR
jgi:ATP-dependent helicase HrpB